MSHPNNNGWQNELIDRLRSHTMALAVAAGNRPNDPQQQVHMLSDVQLGRLLEAAAYDVDYAAVLYWEMMADPSANGGDVNGHAGAGGNHDANLNVNDNNSNERRIRARYDYEEPEDVPSAALPGVDPDRAAAAAADNNESLHMARLREHQQIMLMRNQHPRAQGQAMRLNQRFNPQLQQQADFFNQNANLNLNPNPANLNAQQARQQNAAAAAAAAALFAPQMQPQQAQQMQQEDAIGMAVQMRPQGQQQEHHQDQAQIPLLQRQQGNNRAAGAGPIMIINAISDDEQQQQQAFHQNHSLINNHHTSSSNTSNSNIQQQDGDDDHFLQIQDSSLPSSVLWPPKLDSTSSQEEDDSSHHQRQDVAVQGHGNAVEVDTDMNGDQERSIRDNCNDSRKRSEVPYIPGVWRSIGFSLSSTASGLSIFNKASLDSENEAISIDEGSDITGLLALVTAIMIANCAIQGREVTSSLIRPRFADLSSIDARYSYPNRLVDALSSLVWIALQARDCENQGGKRQKRADLFTAVRWKIAEDGSGQKTCESFATSKVHPQDVKAHIRSCISSFTSPGGCALFLETIMRIHGSERIQKMADTAKVKLPLIEANSENNRFEMNVPLMSLLMTGRIYSSWDGWGANNLGVGILNIDNCRNSFDYNSPLENQVLSRPNKSIWIIKGLEQYSGKSKSDNYLFHIVTFQGLMSKLFCSDVVE